MTDVACCIIVNTESWGGGLPGKVLGVGRNIDN